ncbi:MAG: hypothetical protein ACRDD1_08860, partial [Planctomycetia bacterium]
NTTQRLRTTPRSTTAHHFVTMNQQPAVPSCSYLSFTPFGRSFAARIGRISVDGCPNGSSLVGARLRRPMLDPPSYFYSLSSLINEALGPTALAVDGVATKKKGLDR